MECFLLQKKKGVKKQRLTASYKKSYQQVFCLFSLFSSDGFKGFFRFYKRDFISLKKQVKTAFCFYRVATFPFIRLQESPDKESPSVPAEHERK